jgi:cobalt/nickel transport system permease protein
MHIPDGYLSPSTCASLYVAVTPFWYAALLRAKRAFGAETVPLLSVFAAFCFVIMLFNLPLPGGTTGHAVGMGVACVVLGPWVSILALSAALLIQALFFGDGGITTFGANCFNMAIVGSLVASGVYQAFARGAEITATRRVIAAGLAGYIAINLAALCAAIEFGIQPALFHDSGGTPLYAPYPLGISIPAMMIGHLTFAGLAELIIAAGVVGYLQRAHPALLRLTAPDAPHFEEPARPAYPARFWPASRKLWFVTALLLILTPLGILVVGSGWGEWSATDFSDSAIRHQIAAASRNQDPPKHVPAGLQRLSSRWKAPLANYEPSFIRSHYFGYLVSAAIGVGSIILLSLLIRWLVPRSRIARDRQGEANISLLSSRRTRRGFIEKTLERVSRAMQETLFAENIARRKGLLQTLDARVKLASIGGLILGSILVQRIWALLALFGVSVALALLSRVSLALLAKRIWIAVLAFTGVLALPALFVVPGQIVFRLPLLYWPVTWQGLRAAAFLTLRAETAATLCLLMVVCTPWNHVLKALRFFKIPAVAVVIIEMTYRYSFLFLRTARDMVESRQTRIVGHFEPFEQRRFATATVGVLLDKTVYFSSEVHTAMQARGFRGDVQLLSDLQMKIRDWLQLGAFAGIVVMAVWFGR